MSADEARVVVFTCNWNAYSGLETAGAQRLAYPAGVQTVRVTCLGRLHPGLILRAFELGAEGVLVLGCPPDECHYEFGQRRAEELFAQSVALSRLLGIDEARLRMDWVAAGDGPGFVARVRAFVEGVRRGS